MKKLTCYLATALLMVFLIPTQLKAGMEDDQPAYPAIETVDTDEALPVETAVLAESEALHAESEALLARLEEINEMDKSDLTRSEKRELRKEVRQIDKTLALNGDGVYLSVGAIIIVILLLILLL